MINKLNIYISVVCTSAMLLLASCSQNDEIINVNESTLLRFSVATNGVASEGRASAKLVNQILPLTGTATNNASVVETTTENVESQNAIKTRGTLVKAINADFTTFGYRGSTASTIEQKPWIYAERTNAQGVLYVPQYWSKSEPFAQFFAVYPEVSENNKIRVSDSNYEGAPYIDFEVEEDIKNQKDLLVAQTNVLEYTTQGAPPVAPIVFNHALTAINIAVGQNLSWNKAIDRVELRNVLYKGRYTFASNNENANTWDVSASNERKDFVLSKIYVVTNQVQNTVLVGKDNDNFTFFMIPQELTGNNVELYVHFSDNTELKTTLTGRWEAGTLKTYKLNERNANWTYNLTITPPSPFLFDKDNANFGVVSYRQTTDGTRQPVGWELVGYDSNGDNNFSINEKPQWLTYMSQTTSEGSITNSNVTINTTIDRVDVFDEQNNELRQATSLGTSQNRYNLASNSTGNNITNTANCYIISAPGYYKLPLVYGNAIKNGENNTQAYAPGIVGRNVFTNFIDHKGSPIKSPYINVQNQTSPATTATLMWADTRGLVSNVALERGDNGQQDYLTFEVNRETIATGNALVAVKNAEGTVMWSWHLWFVPQNVRTTQKATNFQRATFNFLSEAIGTKYSGGTKSAYSEARSVRVKIRQTQGGADGKQECVFTITQLPGYNNMSGSVVYYQQGRKDPMCGIDNPPEGSFTKNQRLQQAPTYVEMTQNPDKMLPQPWDRSRMYYNAWSALDATGGFDNNNVVKTIYDPSPVGFKVPPASAFTFVTKTGEAGNMDDNSNTADGSRTSTLFNNAVNNADGFIFLFQGGARSSWGNTAGNILPYNRSGYWTAALLSDNILNAYMLYLRDNQQGLRPRGNNQRYTAYPVLPIAE